MEESDLTILEDLDDKSMLSEMTESNNEMNHLLFQTDCLLSTAESQLETIEAEDKTAWVGDNDPTLLINDISGDLFKGLTSELNFSTSFSKLPLNDADPSDGTHLDEMLNESITAYNTMFDVNGNEKMHDEFDKTLTNSAVNVNKMIYSTPVEKNINEMLEDLNCSLRAYNSEFQISGCVDLDATLIDTSNQNHEISSVTLTFQYNDECNENNETEQSSAAAANNNDSNVPTNNLLVTEDFGQNTVYQKPQAVDKPLDMENSYDITELTPSKDDNHGQIIEKQNISPIKQDKLTVKQINITKHDDNTVIEISTTTEMCDNSVTQSLNVTNEIDQNKILTDSSKESDQIAEQLLKRKLSEHQSTNEENCKKLKSHTDDSSHKEHETKDDNDNDDSDDESLSELQNTIDANFTLAIFDPNETADNIDPGWNGLRELSSSKDYFQSVRDQWRSLSLPNPHRDITRRYVDKHATNNQAEQQQPHGFQDTDRSIPCDKMIDYRIEMSCQRLVAMKNQRNNIRGSPGSRMARKQLTRDIEDTQLLIRNLEKNREEVKQINSFYHGGAGSWDAYFLTRTQARDVQQQDKVFEFQMSFYQSQ